MISKINLNKVASFKRMASLETDKKVNLIYGLNGTGKSIFSNYMYERDNPTFTNCSIEGLNNEDILVYNQLFIHDYFYESDSLKGIFTLSKENKDAKEKIINSERIVKQLDRDKVQKTTELEGVKTEISNKRQNAENKIWEIKTKFTGGDRVLEFCLDGLKGKKEILFDYIIAITKPNEPYGKTIELIKKEVKAMSGDNAQRYDFLPTISFSQHDLEIDELFTKKIIGNENSTLAELILKLENSDWVREGLKYIPIEIEDGAEPCPFCQQETITQTVIDNIKDFFSESYENDVESLKTILSDYQEAKTQIPTKTEFGSNPMVLERQTDFDNKYNTLFKLLNDNLKKIETKIKTPSQPISLSSSIEALNELSQFITDINNLITEHNRKIANRKETLNDLKVQFWNIMRLEYDQTISLYLIEEKSAEKKANTIKKETEVIAEKIDLQNEIITKQQKNTVNIEEAIESINKGLLDLGIDDFSIVKHSEDFYKIVRGASEIEIFHSLSEGEKMIISFLYFLELCRGKKGATETDKRKVIVIDDPISSLSHIYIFNIGQLIKDEFLYSNKYEQIFLLTHSLYFFYELTDIDHDRRKENQNLFRMIKNSDGSSIVTMKYNEIQNDYHSYWHVIKDENQPPALIANCMRNIIEYFFNFIEKTAINNVFQRQQLRENKFQAFNRYINRESHSFGQNIFDYKEFNYDNFKDAFRLVFSLSGYEAHYNKMIK